MSKSLSIIQTVFKVLRIIAKVVFIICLVGAICSAVGLMILCLVPFMPQNVTDIILEETDMGIGAMCIACISGVVACVAEAVIARFCEIYFAHELEAGTPFTYEGSKEIFRLGIISIAVSFGTSVILGILIGIAKLVSGASSFDIDASTSIGTGLVFIFLSVVFKYGAEINQNEKQTEEQQNL